VAAHVRTARSLQMSEVFLAGQEHQITSFKLRRAAKHAGLAHRQRLHSMLMLFVDRCLPPRSRAAMRSGQLLPRGNNWKSRPQIKTLPKMAKNGFAWTVCRVIFHHAIG